MTGQPETLDAREDIPGTILRRAATDPDGLALVFDGAVALSWRKLAAHIDTVTDQLRRSMPPRGRLALHLPNVPELLVALLAAGRIGINAQVLSREWPAQTTAEVVHRLAPDLLIDSVMQFEGATTDEARALTELIPPNLDVPFYTGFTSGTTGLPKGFVRSQHSWIESFRSDGCEFGYGPDDVLAVPGSFVHSMPLYGAVRGLHAGARVLCQTGFRPDCMLESMIVHGATVLYAVPTQLDAIMRTAERGGRSLGAVRLVLTGGASASDALKARVADVFPRAEFCEFYGTSELSYVTVAKASEAPPADSVGRPVHGVKIHILDADDEPLSAGETGRIFVESPFRFLGYELTDGDDELEVADSLPNAFCVGDAGYLDADGFLYLTGRTDRMIITSGRNVHPEAVEAVLERHEALAAAAVIGIGDPRRGKRLVAVVRPVATAAPGAGELIRHCRGALPEHSIPHIFYRLDDWPLTISGKSDFRAVSERLEAGMLVRLP